VPVKIVKLNRRRAMCGSRKLAVEEEIHERKSALSTISRKDRWSPGVVKNLAEYAPSSTWAALTTAPRDRYFLGRHRSPLKYCTSVDEIAQGAQIRSRKGECRCMSNWSRPVGVGGRTLPVTPACWAGGQVTDTALL